MPERNLGVVVLANNFNWDDYIGHTLLLILADRQKLRTQHAQSQPQP